MPNAGGPRSGMHLSLMSKFVSNLAINKLELLAVTASAEEAQRRIKLELYPDNMALPRMLTSLQQQATFIENELKEGGHSEAEVEKINAVK